MFQQDIRRTSSICGDTLTGIPENPVINHPEFKAYPNPFSNLVTFHGDFGGNIRICDLSGRVVREIEVSDSEFQAAGSGSNAI